MKSNSTDLPVMLSEKAAELNSDACLKQL